MKEMSLRELQLFSLDILKDIHQFCVENQIDYSVSDGSLIGAIRHKGFIPWDDDIDIILRRPDYERFCRLYKSAKFKLKCRENDQHCMIPFARVYDNNKTVIKTTAPWCLDEVGVWIDVFPADCVQEDVIKHEKYYDKSRRLWMQSGSARTAYCSFLWKEPLIYNIKLLVKKIIYLNGRRADYYVKKVMARAQSKAWGSTPFWGNLSSMADNIKEHHRNEIFTSCVLKDFEDTQVMVMNGFDEYLRDKYNDYMQLPPEEKRKPHYSLRTKFYWR